jgi:hypothetical protein
MRRFAMVYVISSVEVAPGKMKEAQDWIERFYAYLKKAFALESQRMKPLDPGAGEANRIVTLTPYASLAAWAAHQEKVMKDPERNALVREAFEEKQIIVPNSFTRRIYTVM